MNMRTILPLILAVIVGGLTIKFGKDFMQQMQERQRSASPAAPVAAAVDTPVRQVLLATTDLPIGHALVAGDLTPANAPLELVPSQCIHELPAAHGRVLSIAIAKGQMLTETLLAPVGTSQGLEATIPKGKRAFTVDVNEVSGLAGMIVPGSRVDVVATLTDDKSRESRTWTILQNAPVTAVGTRITNARSADSAGESTMGGINTAASGGATLVKTVTLLVTPEQAETLDLAYTRCKPRLVLRNIGENADDSSPGGITFSQLFQGPGNAGSGQISNSLASLLAKLAASKRPGGDENNDAALAAAMSAPKPPVAMAVAPPTTAPAASTTPKRAVEVVRGGTSTMIYFDVPTDAAGGATAPSNAVAPAATTAGVSAPAATVASKKVDPFEGAPN
jgi:pilus assembly protein CpaB